MRIIKAAELKESFFVYKEMEEISAVKEIIREVRQKGDAALKRYTRKYDGVILENIAIGISEIRDACHNVDDKILSALRQVAENIKKFAHKQLDQFKDFEYEIMPGVFPGQKIIPIERIGVYVPGGRFPLVSTLLMCTLPAQVARVKEIAVCSPPSYNGSIHPAILAAAEIADIKEIYKVGGAQAIAAMAYGTQSIRKVDKIVGPGNKYVALAKKEVFGIVGIDFIAGPTEIMIIADELADPRILAADLLAQAEHDIDAFPTLITQSPELAEKVADEIYLQLKTLSTRNVAKKSMEKNGVIILANNLKEVVQIANKKAPEHLALHVKNPQDYFDKFKSFGSLFIGAYAAEVLGDYSSGINHTLPTNTCARFTAGLSVADFIKLHTTLRTTKDGSINAGTIAKTLAETEGLDGHAKSIDIRK